VRPLLLTLMVVSAFGGNAAFCQTVKVAPYYSAGPGISQLTSSAGTDTSVDWIASGQTDRMLIPRTGSISKVRLYIADRTAISNIYFGVCRWSSGSTWNVAQWTPAIGGPYFANEVNTFTLATPLVAQKYDVLCGRIEWSTPHAQNIAALSPISLPAITGNGNTAQGENCYYQLNAARPASLTTSSMTVIPGNGCPVIEAWMTRPDIVGIGDSIIQKDDSNADAGMVLTRPLSSSVGQSGLSIPYYATVQFSGMTYQDMGWGGQTTTQIQARFAQDALALKPSYIVLNGGVNDVYVNCSTTSGCTSGQMIAIENSLAAMMAAAQSIGTKTFVMLIGPWTGNGSNATNAQMASIDSINANTIAVAPGYGAAVIDQRCVVGQQRASGPAGNCWDIQPQYLYGDGLGVHLNPAGEQQVANLISLSLRSFQYGGRVILKGGMAQK
jgi:lysophospholipase L1-like esterase